MSAATARSAFPPNWWARAGWLLLAGLILFSGSLYLLALTGAGWLGAITPLGGIASIAGWLTVAWVVWLR